MTNHDSTETDRLLAALDAGDRTAMEQLIRLHSPYIRKIIQLRISPELRSRVDVSDVEQETRMMVMRRMDEFITKRPSSFRVWLRSHTIEQLADQYRRHVGAEKRSVRREQRGNFNSSMAIARALLTETPSRHLQRAELAEQVRGLIDSLSEVDREILTLRHGEGLSNSEVAEALEIPIDTARRRHGRALRRLVEKVSAAGLEACISF